jgi:hypothetical protein
MIRKHRARSGYGRGLPAATFAVGKASAGVLQISWNPSYDSNVLAPFWQMYALTHTIQLNDTYHGEDKHGAIASMRREVAQSVEHSNDHDKKGGPANSPVAMLKV